MGSVDTVIVGPSAPRGRASRGQMQIRQGQGQSRRAQQIGSVCIYMYIQIDILSCIHLHFSLYIHTCMHMYIKHFQIDTYIYIHIHMPIRYIHISVHAHYENKDCGLP